MESLHSGQTPEADRVPIRGPVLMRRRRSCQHATAGVTTLRSPRCGLTLELAAALLDGRAVVEHPVAEHDDGIGETAA